LQTGYGLPKQTKNNKKTIKGYGSVAMGQQDKPNVYDCVKNKEGKQYKTLLKRDKTSFGCHLFARLDVRVGI
jgi:hypothetical protein